MHVGEMTLELAQQHKGVRFEVAGAEPPTYLTLDDALPYEIRERRAARGTPARKRNPFAIYFLGDPARVLAQGMQTLTAPELTIEGIFIVPVGQDEEATEYEAVFT